MKQTIRQKRMVSCMDLGKRISSGQLKNIMDIVCGPLSKVYIHYLS